jgi:outer membrane immunogenic protein
MRTAHLILTTTAFIAMATAAQAGEAWPNWYVGLNGGVSYMQDSDLSGGYTGSAETGLGYGAGVSVGYTPDYARSSLGKARVEAEYRVQKNDFDSGTVNGVSQTIGGDITTTAAMLNGFYDFALEGSRVSPYVGAGVGIANTNVETTLAGNAVNNDDNVFAWQLMTGLGYSPESMPFTIWSVGYRYFTTSDASVSDAVGTSVELQNNHHNLEAGAQFRF